MAQPADCLLWPCRACRPASSDRCRSNRACSYRECLPASNAPQAQQWQRDISRSRWWLCNAPRSVLARNTRVKQLQKRFWISAQVPQVKLNVNWNAKIVAQATPCGRWSMSSVLSAEPFLPRIEALHLCAVAAFRHIAPASAMVLTLVEKEPLARLRGARTHKLKTI